AYRPLLSTNGRLMMTYPAKVGRFPQKHALEFWEKRLGEMPRYPREVLQAIEKLSEPSLVVLKDFHAYFQDPAVVRGLRELSHLLKTTYTTAILLSPSLAIPPELEKEITVLDVPLPTFQDLWQLLKDVAAVVRKSGRAAVSLNRDQAEAIVKAAQGLTLSEAENAFAKAVAQDQRLDAQDISLILEEKRQVVRKGGLLEYYSAEETLSDVGGLDLLKQWLARRVNAFSEAARQFGLPEPKGLLLLGVQGCGKSLMAKAVASQWQLPLLRLDMGRIFSGLVGSSEENLRRAIQLAEGVAPVVLWVDEVEKGLSGAGGNHGALDGGVTARVFGTFLTWLQEKKAPVFVVATANRIDGLPPELLRKGRFDEIFFVDLPGAPERREIFRIHLLRRRREPAGFDLQGLAERAESFSGAEIEQAVVSGLYDAFSEGVQLEQRHLETAIGETFPIATTMREEISRLREWARHRTRPASSQSRAGGAG
ncbi:MAG TPA: AAA family ATPase, partial [Myxococcales bacterium]|nr:AAA family ATPase [Myxococcales bacterium]